MKPPQQPFCRGRILIVERPSVFRELQASLLRRASYEVFACDNPLEAALSLSQHRCDVVLLDTEHEPPPSHALITGLRRDRPAVAVVLIVSALGPEFVAEMKQLGVSAVLQRPVGNDTLVRTLEEALGEEHREIQGPGRR
jgi:DNA-binding NtrC family response regulator